MGYFLVRVFVFGGDSFWGYGLVYFMGFVGVFFFYFIGEGEFYVLRFWR